MKKLFNDRSKIVEEMIKGYELAYPNHIKIVEDTHIVTRAQPKETGKVKIVVGNGPGHEPCLSGLVGTGALDMDVLGEVFAAPSYEQYFEGIQHIDDGSPLLMLVMNHAGDVLNANLAYEKAVDAGMTIEKLVFYDDVASAPPEAIEERRGMTGFVYFCKIVGAMAEEGQSLKECLAMGQLVVDNTRTLGVTFEACVHPISRQKLFELPDGICEIGSGAHGEAGSKRMEMSSTKDVVTEMCNMLIEDLPCDEGDEVIMIINGSGATTKMELNIAYKEAYHFLTEKGLVVKEGLIDDFMTTQDAKGFTISVLRLQGNMEKYWNAPCDCPYLCK